MKRSPSPMAHLTGSLETPISPSSPGGTPYRKLFHLVAGSVLPTIAVFVPREVALSLAASLAGVSIVGEYLRLRYEPLNRLLTSLLRPLLKARELRSPTASTYMLIAATIAFAGFPEPIAILALYYTSIGDPLAALIGERWGRVRIGEKTLEGSLAFLSAAVVMAVLLTSTTLDTALAIALIGAGVAAAAEIARAPLDDNLLTPMAAGTVMALVEMAT